MMFSLISAVIAFYLILLTKRGLENTVSNLHFLIKLKENNPCLKQTHLHIYRVVHMLYVELASQEVLAFAYKLRFQRALLFYAF